VKVEKIVILQINLTRFDTIVWKRCLCLAADNKKIKL